MATPQTRTPFEGLTTQPADRAMPSWYKNLVGANPAELPAFIQAVDGLPTAEKRRVAYYDDDLEQWVETERHSALVNPAWLGRDPATATDPDDACWHIPTRQYDVVNPLDAYKPLVAAVSEVAGETEGMNAQHVFGEVRTYRNGGEVHLDVFVPHYEVDAGGAEPLVLGIQTGYDFFGATRLYAKVVAGNPANASVMRDLADRRARRHVKPKASTGTTKQEVTDWWVEELDRLDTVTETLFRVIHEAQTFTFDLDSIPREPEDVYVALDVPQYIAEEAAKQLPANGNHSAWAYYEALAESITHDYDAKDDGGALRRLVRTSNKVLFRPPTAWNTALDQFRRDLKQQQDLEGNRAAEHIAEMQEGVRAAMDDYDDLRTRISAMLAEADEADGEADAA